MDYTIERSIRNELELGEKLLWTGQPNPKRPTLQVLPFSMLGIPIVALGVHMMTWLPTSPMDADPWNPLSVILPPSLLIPAGILVILFGLAVLYMPVLICRDIRKVIYAVTDKRLLILVQGRTNVVRSFYSQNIGSIERKERADGSGDILFARQVGTVFSAQPANTGFLGIPDVRSVERLIADVARQGMATPAIGEAI